MYRVEVGVLLVGNNGTMGLSRWLRLPFAPYPGLELDGITAEPDRPEVVGSVAWDVRKRCFYAELLDRDEPDSGVAELINSYGQGWSLHEPGSAPAEEEV